MCGLFLSREVGPCSHMLLTCLTLSLHHLSNSVCTCLADVHSQLGELPLQDRFLFSLYGFFLLWFTLSFEWLHLHSGAVLVFCYSRQKKCQ